MANTLGDMVVRIVGDNAQFDSSIDKSESKLNKFGNAASNFGKSLSLFVTTPLIGLGVAAVKSSAEMEMLEASFTTMLGSASKAAQLMTDLKNMAAKTPFETSGLAQATKTLLQFGIANENVLPTLQMLGDISGGNSAKLSSLALVFGQMSSAGRLMGQDLLQMINAGFNPLKVISDKTGESMASLKDKMAKGLITTEMVTQAFKSATSEGGRFYKGMDTASKTLEGLTSTLKDDIGAMGRSFSDTWLPTIKEVTKQLSELAKWIGSLNPDTKAFITTIGLFAITIGPAALAVKGFSAALSFLAANPIVIAIAGLVALTTTIVGLTAAAKANREEIEKQWTFDPTKDIEANKKQLATITQLTNQYFKERDALKKNSQEWTIANIKAEQAAQKVREYIKAIEDEEKALQSVNEGIKNTDQSLAATIAARKEAKKIYDDQLIKIKNLVANGLMPEEEALKSNREAAQRYGESLTSLGYKLTDDSLGGQALRDIQKVLNDGNTTIKNKIELLGEYSEASQLATDIVIADNEREKNKRAEEFANRKELLNGWSDESKTVTAIVIADSERKAAEEFANRKELLNGWSDESKKVTDEIIADNEEAANKNKKTWEDYFNEFLSITSNVSSQFKSILNDSYNNQIDTLNAQKEESLRINNEQLQQELANAGVKDKTVIESARIELDEAIKSGDAINIKKANDALTKATIEEDFANKEKEIKKQAALDAYKIEIKQFKANQALSITQALISGAQATLKALELGPVAGPIAATVMAGLTGAQIAAIKNQVAPEPPTFAEGGIIMPRIGGVNATVAEGGQPEVIFPLDKLEDFLSNNKPTAITQEPIHLIIKLNEKSLYEGIFNATKNRTVLIDARALV